MSSLGFQGVTSARFFPKNVIPVAPAFSEQTTFPTGLDCINQYTVTVGAGTSSSTFFAPYTKNLLADTATDYDICTAFETLKLLMGLITVSIGLVYVWSSKEGTRTVVYDITYTYSYGGVTETKSAVVLEGDYVSSVVYLPLPAFIAEDTSGSVACNQSLSVIHIPIVLYVQTTPRNFYRTLRTSGSNLQGIRLPIYIVTDERFLVDKNFDLTLYTPVLSDINSTLTEAFSVNPAVLGSLTKTTSTGSFDVKVIGGFTSTIQYRLGIVPAPGITFVGQSLSNTLGSTLLMNN